MQNPNQNRHVTDPATMLCSCGKTKEQHANVKLTEEKWRQRNAAGKPDVPQMIREVNKATK